MLQQDDIHMGDTSFDVGFWYSVLSHAHSWDSVHGPLWVSALASSSGNLVAVLDI